MNEESFKTEEMAAENSASSITRINYILKYIKKEKYFNL